MDPIKYFDVQGKNILITGGAMGIGRAFSLALAQAGANIAIADINREQGDTAVAELKRYGVRSLYIECDVSCQIQVKKMVKTVVDNFGTLDVAINNAGIGIPGEDIDQPLADWNKVMGINLTGVWLCAQSQAEQMRSQLPVGGKIINIASIASAVIGQNGAYSASKAAVVHLSKALASRWGQYNISVNCISPGFVVTPMIAAMTEEEMMAARDTIPLGYLLRPQDLSATIVYLASDASNYMTGHELVLDGGLSILDLASPKGRAVPPCIGVEDQF